MRADNDRLKRKILTCTISDIKIKFKLKENISCVNLQNYK